MNTAAAQTPQSAIDTEAFAFGQQDIFARNADVVESNDGVVERMESHEAAAGHDFDARRVHFQNERRDLIALAAVDDFGWRLGHNDDDAGFDAVGTPEFLTVDDERGAIWGGIGAGLHAGRI